MLFRFIFAVLFLFSTPAIAQNVKSTFNASNGIVVSVNSDEFAGRYEYTAPVIDFPGLSGFAIVAAVKTNAATTEPKVVGSIMYQGEWRRYYAAILRGGEKVDATFADRDVVSCRGSRGRGCSLREGFDLMPTEAQIEKFAEEGVLKVQLQAQSGPAVLIEVPVSYFDAVREASAD